MAQKHIDLVLISINTVCLLFLPPAECWAGGPSLGVGGHTHSSVSCSDQDGDISGPDPLGAELLRRMAIDRKKAQNWGCWGSGQDGMRRKGSVEMEPTGLETSAGGVFSSLYPGLQAKSPEVCGPITRARPLHLCQPSGSWCPSGAWPLLPWQGQIGPLLHDQWQSSEKWNCVSYLIYFVDDWLGEKRGAVFLNIESSGGWIREMARVHKSGMGTRNLCAK